MKILVCDDLSEKGLALLRAIPGVQIDVKIGLSEEKLIDVMGSFEALVVRSATRVTERILEAGRNLRVVARAGMGYDNIDVPAATRRGIVVMNTPGSNAVTTAEHTIAMMMSLSRSIPQAHMALAGGKWDRKSFVGTELAGKTLGIIGLGNVGRHVASRARGLQMNVIAHDPFIPEKVAAEAGITLLSMDDLLSRCHFLTLHATLTPATRHMIGATQFMRMRDGVRIINCARGELIDEKALIEALDSGKVAGAALDVFEEEPPPKDHPLLRHPKVIKTPHLGASTAEAQEQVVIAAAEQLRAYIMDEIVINGVNVPSISREALTALVHYMDLAARLGSLLAQLALPPIEEIRIECSGEITKHDVAPITVSAVRGILERFSSQPINFVNALVVAKERGIRVVEAKTNDAGNYLSLIMLAVKAGDQTHRVAGAVFGRDKLRLVRFDDYFLEVSPRGHLVIMHNEDRPGVIGAWGTILGKHRVNISQMQVALDAAKGQALSIVNVDTPVPEAVLEELRAVSNIRDVIPVELPR